MVVSCRVAAEPQLERATPAQVMANAYRQHQRYVWRTLRYLGVRYADADDAVQQVFLVVHRRADEYVSMKSKRGWLASVSKFVSCNYHRGIRREKAREQWFTREPLPDVEELVARREARRMLGKFLSSLRKPERSTFYLTYFAGLSGNEIAARLRMNPNTVRTRLRFARLRFIEELAGTG